MDRPLYSLKEAAELLGVRRETITDLVRTHGIEVCRHPNQGNAKALEQVDFDRIKAMLRPVATTTAG